MGLSLAKDRTAPASLAIFPSIPPETLSLTHSLAVSLSFSLWLSPASSAPFISKLITLSACETTRMCLLYMCLSLFFYPPCFQHATFVLVIIIIMVGSRRASIFFFFIYIETFVDGECVFSFFFCSAESF